MCYYILRYYHIEVIFESKIESTILNQKFESKIWVKNLSQKFESKIWINNFDKGFGYQFLQNQIFHIPKSNSYI